MTSDDSLLDLSGDRVKEKVGFWIEGILLPILSFLGILGNILCVWIFNRKDVELKPSFANLLKCLSVYDIVLLACLTWQYSLPYMSEYYTIWILPHTTPYILPIIQIALTGSIYSIVSVAVERFVTVCYPFYTCKMCNGFGYILPLVLFSVGFNVVKFFELETAYIDVERTTDNWGNASVINVTYPILNATYLRRDPLYSKYVVFLLNFLVMGLIPVTLLTILNLFIYRSISAATAAHNVISSTHRRENTMAGVLMSIVVVFIICNSSRIVVNCYVSVQIVEYGELARVPLWADIMVQVNHLLLTFNSAANIVIYSLKDCKFRTALFSMFSGSTSNASTYGTSIRSSFGSSRYISRIRDLRSKNSSPRPTRTNYMDDNSKSSSTAVRV